MAINARQCKRSASRAANAARQRKRSATRNARHPVGRALLSQSQCANSDARGTK